jgi:hypothetical protein
VLRFRAHLNSAPGDGLTGAGGATLPHRRMIFARTLVVSVARLARAEGATIAVMRASTAGSGAVLPSSPVVGGLRGALSKSVAAPEPHPRGCQLKCPRVLRDHHP